MRSGYPVRATRMAIRGLRRDAATVAAAVATLGRPDKCDIDDLLCAAAYCQLHPGVCDPEPE